MNAKRAAFIFTFAAAAACGDERGGNVDFPHTLGYGPGAVELFTPPPDGGGGIAGDWFICKELDCRELDDDGIRFTSDGFIMGLDAPGGTLEPGEAYCEEEVNGTYDYDGTTLKVRTRGEAVSVPWVIDGDRARSVDDDDDPFNAMRINPPRSIMECDKTVPINVSTDAPPPRSGG